MMSFRDRLKTRADNALSKATDAAGKAVGEAKRVAGESGSMPAVSSALETAKASAAAGAAKDAFAGLQGVSPPKKESVTVEGYLERLVAAVRKDDCQENRTDRDAYLDAKRRRRKLGLASIGTGPFSGVTSQLVDLYCDVAILVDLVEVRGLALNNKEIAAHAVVLWGFTDDYGAAFNGMTATPSVTDLVTNRLWQETGERLPETLSVREVSVAIWKSRAAATKVRKISPLEAAKGAAFTGSSTKATIQRIDEQLVNNS